MNNTKIVFYAIDMDISNLLKLCRFQTVTINKLMQFKLFDKMLFMKFLSIFKNYY